MYLSRDYQETDFSSLELIYHDAVMGQGRRGYSDEQVQVWAAFPYLYRDNFSRLIRSGYTRVMTLHHIPVAFATLNPDHYLALVYVLEQHSGRGLAGRLCEEIEQEARRRGVACLGTDASVLSRPMFEQRGFVLTEQQEVCKAGQTFTRFIMEKKLV
ncbi:GNAT family N-acetyltransferase [Oceanimonas baumannii]|uniref:Acetyltransferase n=1 Tax=Oceanimonas baumannii TaxID=129578 RepID=A0A235CA77_9GAMM|nr:GNAT family N-acetyltransferase [Oceanimonas baumannii]MCC4262996.1 GNAT family N-acetyltransferase [Oceanimonas baumannii]OYD21316.1 GNAT family N-acetyltransferase [Oceanimonas baumannii]TDW55799.1 putative acetyltransferase [Oceanimonas baumannii]